MNIDFNDAKDHFIKHGYCQFSLKDFDIDFYNFLDKFLACDVDNNLREMFHIFRFDSNEIEIRYESPTNSHIDARQKQRELYDKLTTDSKLSQCWYVQCDPDKVQSFFSKNNPDFKHINVNKLIESKTNDILKYFYDNVDDKTIIHDQLSFSLYDIDNLFRAHSDDISVNLCSIIIYLNKDYKKENGGLLELNDEPILPELGNVALMDLSKHSIKHGVTKVVSGPGRYAIFNFPRFKV